MTKTQNTNYPHILKCARFSTINNHVTACKMYIVSCMPSIWSRCFFWAWNRGTVFRPAIQFRSSDIDILWGTVYAMCPSLFAWSKFIIICSVSDVIWYIRLLPHMMCPKCFVCVVSVFVRRKGACAVFNRIFYKLW